jgi:Xaa-Pro aminopeptidase
LTTVARIELAELKLPDFGLPTVEPEVPAETYAARLEAARQRTTEAGYDALLVYADREHFANLAYLTRFDPRFEEALLILAPGQEPTLLVGNEGMAYTAYIPVPVKPVLFQSFSLISQPRGESAPLSDILQAAGVAQGSRVGIAGWKYYTTQETSAPDSWIESPSYIVDTLRGLGCTVENATALFMEPETGLRAINEIDQLAVFEYASTVTSQGMRDMIFSVKPGMTEYDMLRKMQWPGIPLSYHPTAMTGDRTRYALAGPSSKTLVRGERIFAGYGVWGTNTARGGYLVEDETELPENIRDYVAKLVAPYFAAVADWYETIGIGVTGGELHEVIHRWLGEPFFGVTLNPGHLVHLDEWVSSPVYAGSTQPIQAGMAIQVDVIPSTGTEYWTTNIEDTIAILDEGQRAEFAARYPEAWGRVQKRRDFMENVLGIRLKPEVLPFSNLPAYLPPYWLAPQKALRVKR